MPEDYDKVVKNLKQSEPDIQSVVILEEDNKIVFSTNDWDINEDVEKVIREKDLDAYLDSQRVGA
ncbi:MAG: hypothetical protein ACFFAO_18375 [Candidatus Hermodarchaeota archaeon]